MHNIIFKIYNKKEQKYMSNFLRRIYNFYLLYKKNQEIFGYNNNTDKKRKEWLFYTTEIESLTNWIFSTDLIIWWYILIQMNIIIKILIIILITNIIIIKT